MALRQETRMFLMGQLNVLAEDSDNREMSAQMEPEELVMHLCILGKGTPENPPPGMVEMALDMQENLGEVARIVSAAFYDGHSYN